MTALLKDELYLTPEEYLALERTSPVKHEYCNGYLHAMAGASREHNVIAGNIFASLHQQLGGKRCQPFGSDMRLRIQLPDEFFFYYPDVTVDCSDRKTIDTEEPTVIFEVLSNTTGRNDHFEKVTNYLNLPSMRVYALVDQRRLHVLVHRRRADGSWGKETITEISAALRLPEIECGLPLRTIYGGLL